MSDSDEITRAKEQVNAHAEMYRERWLTVQLSLWNTLATLDGLMIGGAAVLAAFGHDVPAWCPLGIVIVSITSLILLTLNFYSCRRVYRILGCPPPDSVWESETAWEKHRAHLMSGLDKAKCEQRSVARRENACACLAAIGLILFIIGFISIYAAHNVSRIFQR